jgi:kexin
MDNTPVFSAKNFASFCTPALIHQALAAPFIFRLSFGLLGLMGMWSPSFCHASTTWDASQPTELRISDIVVNDWRYTDVRITIGQVLDYKRTGPNRSYDSFNPSNGQLTIAELVVAGQSYYDVIVTVAEVKQVGSRTALTGLIPNDPLFSRQWHLLNTGQTGADGVKASAGQDLNVSKAWAYATGKGIQIAVVDDGIDLSHEDLAVVSGKSWDYRLNRYGDPSSTNSDHGTACAGLVAAKGNNGIGVTGVAFNARLVGYNLLAASSTAYDADAVVKDLASNHIYTNSYGAPDNTGGLYPAETLWEAAIETGVTTGRNGKGVIYTWAAGNGAPVDRSDYDGQANHPMVFAIGALNAQGQRASYSEPGANLLVSTFGGEFCDSLALTTTDVTGRRGFNSGNTPGELIGLRNYTQCMNGSSAATPLAAGVAALLLEVNPQLSWRDVRAILASSARKTDPTHPDWRTNGAGLSINHDYGFGVIDALAAVRTALTWPLLRPAKRYTAHATAQLPAAIADAGVPTLAALTISNSGLQGIEFVELHVTSDHTDIGDLEITLTSPQGTISTVSTPRSCLDEYTGQVVTCGAQLASGFRFGIVRLLGESPDGTWTLAVRDTKAGDTGRLTAWHLVIHGH